MSFLYSPYAIVGVIGTGCLLVILFCVWMMWGGLDDE